jgi:hypothetical protein
MMLKKISLKNNNAFQYIINQLSLGGEISNYLQKFNLGMGTLITYLPEEVDTEKITDWSESIDWLYGKNVTKENENILINLISKFMKMKKGNCFLSETLCLLGDPILNKKNFPYISYNNQIFGYLINISSDELIRTVLINSRRYPFVGLLTELPNGLDAIYNKQKLSENTLERLIKLTRYIIIGAFDDEGFIIWSKVKDIKALFPLTLANSNS